MAAHPRVGGEHGVEAEAGWHLPRLIPAWAGNTSRRSADRPGRSAHPRVGGEHTGTRIWQPQGGGSSPRGRGTPPWRPCLPPRRRLIPAWAGNTQSPLLRRRCTSAHPRVGGEHLGNVVADNIEAGSSPRGRGTQKQRNGEFEGKRLIPAWAGNTARQRGETGHAPAHPRVGGEHSAINAFMASASGSSPRGRGTHFFQLIDLEQQINR